LLTNQRKQKRQERNQTLSSLTTPESLIVTKNNQFDQLPILSTISQALAPQVQNTFNVQTLYVTRIKDLLMKNKVKKPKKVSPKARKPKSPTSLKKKRKSPASLKRKRKSPGSIKRKRKSPRGKKLKSLTSKRKSRKAKRKTIKRKLSKQKRKNIKRRRSYSNI
jgi:hypothetical protein